MRGNNTYNTTQRFSIVKKKFFPGRKPMTLNTHVAPLLRDIQLRLSQWGYWAPLFTIWRSPWVRDYGGVVRVGRPVGAR